jgi:polysaccharide pyruvyl transferase WcaK-like protein
VSIAGFYGVNNIGDEAILTAMIEQFSSIPEVRLHVLALEPKFVRKIYKINSSNCLWHRNPLTFIKATSTCDLFILGGGELIHDFSIWRHPIFGVFLSKVFQKKAMTYAVSARPFKSSAGAAVFRNALEAFDVITVRDNFSKDYISSLGITKKIHVTADPTLLLKPKFVEAENLPKYGIPFTDEIRVGVNVRRLWNFFDGTVEKQMARICDSLVKEINARIIFFPLQIKGMFSDVSAIYRTKYLMKN